MRFLLPQEKVLPAFTQQQPQNRIFFMFMVNKRDTTTRHTQDTSDLLFFRFYLSLTSYGFSI